MTTTSLPLARCGLKCSNKSTVTSGFDPRLYSGAALYVSFADQLRDDIHPMCRHVARHLGVVGADIVTLRMRHIEQCAGIQKELHDLHIGSDISFVQIADIVQRPRSLRTGARPRVRESAARVPMTIAARAGSVR